MFLKNLKIKKPPIPRPFLINRSVAEKGLEFNHRNKTLVLCVRATC